MLIKNLSVAALFSLSLNAFAYNTNTTNVRKDLRTGPNPEEFYVESISYGGTGCPQGTVGKSISDDRETFTLIFDNFVASVGPGIPITESRKSCQLNLNLHVPQGWSFAIVDTTFRGYVQLAAGQTGSLQSRVYFNGSHELDFRTGFVGPIARDYTATDRIRVRDRVWSECGAVTPMNIEASISIIGHTSSQGQMTVDSEDGQISHNFGIEWKQCHQ